MLKMADLAARPDFEAGMLLVSPARRIVRGPQEEIHLEPRIMQVFLLLLDADGRVVTRNEIFDQCWGGAMVGDDSLNRAIAGVRRIATEVAPGAFEVETIPRTGYRLIGDILGKARPEASHGEDRLARPFSRRKMLATGLAASALATGGYYWFVRETVNPEAARNIEQGSRILRDSWPGTETQAVEVLRKAVAIEPRNAVAWGLLAVAIRNVAEGATPDQTSKAVRDCETAAQRALVLNPREGNALAALATLRPYFGDWSAGEDRLRKVLRVAPYNLTAMSHLITLLQSVGRARESWGLNERAVALEPLSPAFQFRRALKLWIFDRVPEADLTIDRALQLWPRHPAVWTARLYIFAFTRRPHAALAMIDDVGGRPPTFQAISEQRWRVSLRALETGSPADVEAATAANRQVAAGGLAIAAIMILSSLKQLDAAFDVASGFLLRKGRFVAPLWPGTEQMAINDQQWRRTMNLFTPATAAMRGDPRFRSLCDGIGLTDYWRSRGVGPDSIFSIA